jgi:hypothetical protein
MRRLLMRLVVMAVMAALLAASAVPAFAQGKSETAPNCEYGSDTAYFNNGLDNRNVHAINSLNKNYNGNSSFGKNPNAAYCLQ